MKLGNFLALKRKSLNMTQQQLADKLETSVAYVSAIENGIKKLSPEKIIDYCTALQCDNSALSTIWDFVVKEELERMNNKYADFKKLFDK